MNRLTLDYRRPHQARRAGMNNMPSGRLKQTGAVLVMALVMLAVMTLIGVSSMSSSSLEMKVASNMQQRNIAFQGAQARLAFASADDKAANGIDYLIAIPDVTDPSTWPQQTCNSPKCLNGTDWAATATVDYLSCAKGLGSSLEAGKGFSYRAFEIKATANNTPGGVAGNARSIQTSAIRFPVKSCGDEL